MQSFAVLAFAHVAVAENRDISEQWATFKSKFNPTFVDAEEESFRLSVFKENLAEAAEMQKHEPLATLGMTKFSHLTKAEFRAMTGYVSNSEAKQEGTIPFVPYTEEQLMAVESSVDWRTKGAVTPIKDQGQCGSCYAFSTTGNIEGVSAAAGHPLVSLSEQEFTSCVSVTPPGGQCHGGLPKLNFQWLLDHRNGDVLTEEIYPYGSHDFWSPPCTHVCRGTQAESDSDWCSTSCNALTPLCPADRCNCTSDGKNVGATITGWKALPSDENQMKAYLAEHGPVSIGVSTSGGFQHYAGGIISNCGDGMVDHAVLLVGFTEEYWIIKNSWNTNWGEDGYMRAQFGTNQCNLAHEPTTSVVDSARVVV